MAKTRMMIVEDKAESRPMTSNRTTFKQDKSNLVASYPKIIWQHLTQPAVMIQDIALRRRSWLLSTFLLSMIALFILFVIALVVTTRGFAIFWPIVSGFILLGGAYVLNRTKYYTLAAIFTILSFPAVIFPLIASNASPNPLVASTFLVLGLLLSSILLSARGTALMALINLVGILLLPELAPLAIPNFASIVSPLALNLIAAFLIILAMYHRNQLERDRQAELRASEKRFRTLYNHTPIMMHSLDKAGNLVNVNDFWLKTMGYKKVEVVGRKSTEFLTAASRHHVEAVVLPEYLKTGVCLDIPCQFVKKNGEVMDVLLSATAERDGLGQIKYSLVVLHDITERKQSEAVRTEALVRLQSINQIAQGIISGLSVTQLVQLAVSLVSRHFGDYRVAYATIDSDGWLELLCAIEPDDMPKLGREKVDLNAAPGYLADLRAGRILQVEDVRQDDRLTPIVDSLISSKTFARLDVPLHHTGGLVGVFSFTASAPHQWTNQDRAILREVARYLSVALQEAQARAEHKLAEQALRESEARLQIVMSNLPVVLFVVDREGIFTLSEGRGLAALGFQPGQVVGQSAFDFYKDVPEVLQALQQGLAGKTLHSIMHSVADLTFETFYTPLIDTHGEMTGLIGVAVDITERKQAEEQIKASLKEKEVLLKEIHHRVKNNLQVVSSLLDLQSEYIADQQARELFKESQHRIKSMAMIHERLYESHDLARINFAEYIESLTNHLLRSYGGQIGNVNLKLNLVPVFFSVETAIPCGLIINELVSNSLKHAFPNGRAGEICVGLRIAEDQQLTLRVKDDGVGLPPGVDLRRSTSLGLTLVTTLVKQLQGDLELLSQAGTEFRVTFVV